MKQILHLDGLSRFIKIRSDWSDWLYRYKSKYLLYDYEYDYLAVVFYFYILNLK